MAELESVEKRLVTFEDRVLEKLDEIQATQGKHGERLAALEERTKAPRGKAVSISSGAVAGAVGGLLSFLAQHWSKTP